MREEQLLPVRHPQGELFLCDLGDVPLKGDMASMEHPIYALSTRKDTTPRVYEHNGNTVTITPSALGHATIYDKDILIFAISQIMEAKNNGEPYSKRVSFNALDFMKFSNRDTSGKAYNNLRESLKRLHGTSIETNIVTGDVEQTEGFNLIEKYRVRRELRDGTVTDWGVELSDWLFNAIEANEVLTLHPDYFRLRKPLERRIYELLRKHCGEKKSWKITTRMLLKKTGSQTSLKKFRQLLKPIMEADHLPDYTLAYEDEKGEMILVRRRPKTASLGQMQFLHLMGDTMIRARKLANGLDVYALEQQWKAKAQESNEKIRDPDAAFLGFVKAVVKNRKAK